MHTQDERCAIASRRASKMAVVVVACDTLVLIPNHCNSSK